MRPALAPIGAAALLAIAGCSGQGDPPSSRPYVQDVGRMSARIALETSRLERLTVAFGEDGGPLDRSAAEPRSGGGSHEVRLEGLEPDRRYRYRATGVGGRVLGEAVFRTDPGPGVRPIAFAALGDSGRVDESKTDPWERLKGLYGSGRTGRGRQGDVATGIIARDPDLVIHAGDVVYPEGAAIHYADGFFKPLGALIDHVPLYPTLGNHDAKSDQGAPYLAAFHLPESDAGGERFYSFDWGDVHFTSLDTETSGMIAADSPQVAWLEQDLASANRAWKVVFFHKPVMSDGSHGDTPGLKEVLAPLFVAYGVDLVVNGHDHIYERFYPVDGVTYLVTGGGGNELYPVGPGRPETAYAESVLHFVLARADARTLSIEAIDLDGRTFDSVVLFKDP